MVLADKRLITKYYGKKFLNSLPSNNIAMMPCSDIVAEVADRAAIESLARVAGGSHS